MSDSINFVCVDTQRVPLACCYDSLSLWLGLSSSPAGGRHLFYALVQYCVRTVTGGVGWFAPKSTNCIIFNRFDFFYLAKPQEQRVTLQSKRDFMFQICNNNLFSIQIIHLWETQAIFILFFLGPFFKNKKIKKTLAQGYLWKHLKCFFCEREKKDVYIFHIFVPCLYLHILEIKSFLILLFLLNFWLFILSTRYCGLVLAAVSWRPNTSKTPIGLQTSAYSTISIPLFAKFEGTVCRKRYKRLMTLNNKSACGSVTTCDCESRPESLVEAVVQVWMLWETVAAGRPRSQQEATLCLRVTFTATKGRLML